MTASAQEVSNTQSNTIFVGLVFSWSTVIVALFAWGYSEKYDSTVANVRSVAIESYNKDVVYRRWAANHGGIYAPITPETPPNPYLADIPERDISTPSGKKLTLINPAYMTRQVNELGEKTLGLRSHLTSLKLIRPENAADEWEKRALQAFERGAQEASSIELLGGEPYLAALPLLEGAAETVAAGILSSLQPANVRLRRALRDQPEAVNHPVYPLLFDPQTAGGLLASVPRDRAEACVAALRGLGYAKAGSIGCILAQGDALAPIYLKL